jgi:hypothetical protein
VPVHVSIVPANVALDPGKTQQFNAYVTGADNTAVRWSVNGSIGGSFTYGLITATGLYTAPATTPNPSTVSVTATSVVDPNASATAPVTINLVIVCTTCTGGSPVSISPRQVAVPTSASQQFTATTIPANSPVTWSVNGAIGGFAAIGTITQTGIYTAPSSVPSNPYVSVTAALTSDATKSDTATVTLVPAAVRVSITPETATLNTGAHQQFAATVLGANITDVTWSASAGTITSTGFYTAPATTPSPALVRVTATSVADPTASAIALVSIATAHISIEPNIVTLNTGGHQQFFLTFSGTADTAVRWTVGIVYGGSPEVGLVSQMGAYTAPSTVPSNNLVKVIATSLADPSVSATAYVTIQGSLGTVIPPSPDWSKADIIFPKGTRSVRWHLDDIFRYTPRQVYVSMFVVGNPLGWGTFVYPDGYPGVSNPPFYFGAAPVNAVGAGVGITDGSYWELQITCTKADKTDFFGFYGIDGILHIDSPTTLDAGDREWEFKVAVGQTTTIRFSVDPFYNSFAVANATSPGTPGGPPTGTLAPGVITTVAGSSIAVLPEGNGTTDAAGNFYFSDRAFGANAVRKLTPSGVLSTVVGNGLSGPAGLAWDGANLYIADSQNNRVLKVDSTGTITTVAGNGSPVSSGDNGPAGSAGLASPFGVAVDDGGNLYIAESLRVRKVGMDGIITTYAGNGQLGVDDDNVPATTTSIRVTSIAVDKAGNLYIADTSRATGRVREVIGGIITTVAGTGNCCVSSGDGAPASAAVIGAGPSAIAVDKTGAIYIGDGLTVRKIGTDGVINRIAGTGTAGTSGDGGPAISAQFQSVNGLAVDGSGDIFIGDLNRIREIGGGTVTAPVLPNVTSDPGITIANHRTTTEAPPSSGCTLPDAVTAFLTTDATVYLYLDGAATRSVTLSTDWLAPDGTIFNGATWTTPSGNSCFTSASLSIASLPPTRLGSWLARVYVSGTLIFTLPFTVNAPAQPATPPGQTRFLLSATSGTSILANDVAQPALVSGYAKIQADPGSATPDGLAIFGNRTNGILVSEAGVPATPTLRYGRIYADVTGPLNTGIAIVNPNPADATVNFYFTDANGNDFGSGSTVIPANSKLVGFLSDAPFSAGQFEGSFTFFSSQPVAAIALRGLTNERSEFLMTTLPVTDLSSGAQTDPVVFPHFADGGGWFTEIVLVNPGNTALTGAVQFRSPGGSLETVTVNGAANSVFPYSIPPRTSLRLQTNGGTSTITSGSVVVIPDTGMAAPSGVSIFTFRNSTATVSEAGVPSAPPGTAFTVYAEATGVFPASGSAETGVAVTNTSGTDTAQVTLELTPLTSTSSALKGTLSIPPNGQIAEFLGQIPGFETLPAQFQGVLRLSSSTPISVVGLRGRYNERSEFLMTTTPASNGSVASSDTLYFPHWVIGGGFTTEFILLGAPTSTSSSGTLQFFSPSGAPFTLPQ